MVNRGMRRTAVSPTHDIFRAALFLPSLAIITLAARRRESEREINDVSGISDTEHLSYSRERIPTDCKLSYYQSVSGGMPRQRQQQQEDHKTLQRSADAAAAAAATKWRQIRRQSYEFSSLCYSDFQLGRARAIGSQNFASQTS